MFEMYIKDEQAIIIVCLKKNNKDCLHEVYIKDEQTTKIVYLRLTLKENKQPRYNA